MYLKMISVTTFYLVMRFSYVEGVEDLGSLSAPVTNENPKYQVELAYYFPSYYILKRSVNI